MNVNDIHFSIHVEKRIDERQLEKIWIIETIMLPDKIVVVADNEVQYFKKIIKVESKFLKVIFNPQKKLVITAYFDKKMTKTYKQ